MDTCTLTADVIGRQHLRSAPQRKLAVPRYLLNSFCRRRFSVAGPSTWNSLPDSFVTQNWVSTLSSVSWRYSCLRNILRQNVLSAVEIVLSMWYVHLYFTQSLTYLLTVLSQAWYRDRLANNVKALVCSMQRCHFLSQPYDVSSVISHWKQFSTVWFLYMSDVVCIH